MADMNDMILPIKICDINHVQLLFTRIAASDSVDRTGSDNITVQPQHGRQHDLACRNRSCQTQLTDALHDGRDMFFRYRMREPYAYKRQSAAPDSR